MAEYKLVNATQLDADLTSICDTIRNDNGSEYSSSDTFPFPEGIKTAITTISDNNYWNGHRDGYVDGIATGHG
jgi:hypothetical protein